MPGKSFASPLVVLVLVGAVVGVWQNTTPLPTAAASNNPTSEATVYQVDVYDADKNHLWNRLHAALFVRLTTTRGDVEELVPQDHPENLAYDLDPLLWHRSRYLVTGPGHKPALAVLDEFLAKDGEKLIPDPLKRAFLQHDLWALFDTVLANYGWTAYPESHVRPKDPSKAARRALAERVVAVMRRLALTRKQIAALPDNYAAAIAARAYPATFDTAKGDVVFLPSDLWEPNGSWVLLGDRAPASLTLTHNEFFGGRSTFFVFLHLPQGRDATCEYLGELRAWAHDGRKGDPPPLPFGTSVALARQMVLMDDSGELVPARLTESVQIRAFRATQEAEVTDPKRSTVNHMEVKLRRPDLLAGKAGGLTAVKDDENERAYLIFLGHNAGEGREKVMTSCFSCHQRSALASFNTLNRPFEPFAPKPDLTASSRNDEAHKALVWKRRQFTWQLVNWLRED